MITNQIWRGAQNLLINVCHSTPRTYCAAMEAGLTYYASFADKPVYLKELSENSVCTENGPDSSISACFPESPKDKAFIVAEKTGVVNGDSVTQYIKSCVTLHKLLRSADRSDYEIVLGAVHRGPVSEVRGHLKRCLFFSAKRTVPNGASLSLPNMAIPKDVQMYEFVQRGNKNVFEMTELNCDILNKENNKPKKFELVCPLDPLTGVFRVPPMFQTDDFSPVYQNFERTMDILQKVSDIKQVEELLEIRNHKLPEYFNTAVLQSKMNHAFIVVEGMDAAGKTTLTETLECKLRAVRYHTPPPCIQHLRRFFDGFPEIIRRAYYSLGNYIVSVQIAEECQNKPVIMDRFWHSTAAYGIANETTLSDLPPEGHMTYSWPDDLLKPNCVLFLTVTEEVRKQRMNQRNEAMTYEEKSLHRDGLFRQRLCEAYKRMKNPRCTEIDASGTREEVVEMALTALLEHGVSLS